MPEPVLFVYLKKELELNSSYWILDAFILMGASCFRATFYSGPDLSLKVLSFLRSQTGSLLEE